MLEQLGSVAQREEQRFAPGAPLGEERTFFFSPVFLSFANSQRSVSPIINFKVDF